MHSPMETDKQKNVKKNKQTHSQTIPKQTCTAGAASAFEPDFVFPLENVTVAQGRDGLYSNKSNEIFTCVESPPTPLRSSSDGET